MHRQPILLAFALACLLGACGGEGPEPSGARPGTPGSDSAKADTAPNPVVGLTSERLDSYIEILKSTDEDHARMAMNRGWKITDWVRTHATIRGIVKAGGLDAHLERIRARHEDAQEKVADMESRLDDVPENQRPFLEKSIQTMKQALKGWRRTLDSAEQMRAGGDLIEGRMDEIRAALGR